MPLFPSVNKSSISSSYLQGSSSWGVEVVLLIIVLVLSYIFVVSPKASQLKQAKNGLAEVQAQQKDLNDNAQVFNALEAQLAKSQDEVKKLDEALPLDSKITTLYILLSQLVQQSGMSANGIDVTPGPKGVGTAGSKSALQNDDAKRNLVKIAASIKVAGNVGQLKTLLEKIENSGRVLDITSLNVTPSSSDSAGKSASGLEFDILLSGYAYE